MIPVVLFDLDDTLFRHRHAVETGIAAHLESLDLDSTDAAARWHELEELHYPRYLTGELDLLGQRRVRSREMMRPWALDLTSDHAADAWYDAYYRQYQRAWSLHDDALPCLDALAAGGARVGLITNGDLAFQTEKITAVGLDRRVEAVIASGEVGVAKPDERIFRHACAVFGVAPPEAMYVGDRLRTDAIGAASAGLVGVWLNRSGVTDPAQDALVEASGIAVISTLAELPGLAEAAGITAA